MFNERSISVFFFTALFFVSSLDIFSVELLGMNVKAVQFFLPFLFFYFILISKAKVDKGIVLALTVFVVSLLPSIFFSISIYHSVSYFAGVITSIFVLLTACYAVVSLGDDFDRLFVNLYRSSVIISFILVFTGVQQRGSFLLYEASYWAIMLIPYMCITASKFYQSVHQWKGLDLALIAGAIIISQSASMVIWLLLSFLVVGWKLGRLNYYFILLLTLLTSAFSSVVIIYNNRASKLTDLFFNVGNFEEFVRALMFLVGNRLQRVYVGLYTFLDNLWAGVGIGALRVYAEKLNEVDFEIYGSSAYDFTLDSSAPATNVYLELLAESGILGGLGFIVLLIYIYRHSTKFIIISAYSSAFLVTSMSLLIESSYLRPYVWMLYGVVVGKFLYERSKKNVK